MLLVSQYRLVRQKITSLKQYYIFFFNISGLSQFSTSLNRGLYDTSYLFSDSMQIVSLNKHYDIYLSTRAINEIA